MLYRAEVTETIRHGILTHTSSQPFLYHSPIIRSSRNTEVIISLGRSGATDGGSFSQVIHKSAHLQMAEKRQVSIEEHARISTDNGTKVYKI